MNLAILWRLLLDACRLRLAAWLLNLAAAAPVFQCLTVISVTSSWLDAQD